MQVRRFNNRNASLHKKYSSFWEQTLDPDFYALASYWDLFKTEILDSFYVEPSASFWAVDGSPEDPNPVACLVAAFAPTDDELDCADASLLAPFFAAGVADADKATAASLLIEASENALREKGVRRVYAGGAPPRTDAEGYAPIGAPLLNGVYGFGSPVGFFDDDPARKFFIEAGYKTEKRQNGGERAFVERKIDAAAFFASDADLPAGSRLVGEPWQARTWRLATIGRNFLNPRCFSIVDVGGEILAVALGYDLVRRVPTTDALAVRTVVSRLAVRPKWRGQGLGTAALAAFVEDATTRAAALAPNASLEICAVVSDGDAVARDFWDAQGFEVGRRSTPLVKTLDA